MTLKWGVELCVPKQSRQGGALALMSEVLLPELRPNLCEVPEPVGYRSPRNSSVPGCCLGHEGSGHGGIVPDGCGFCPVLCLAQSQAGMAQPGVAQHQDQGPDLRLPHSPGRASVSLVRS